MTVHNIALIFGPTLFGANMSMMTNGHGAMNGGPSPGGGASGIGDVGAQNKVSRASCTTTSILANGCDRQLRRFSIAIRIFSLRNETSDHLHGRPSSFPLSRNGPLVDFNAFRGIPHHLSLRFIAFPFYRLLFTLSRSSVSVTIPGLRNRPFIFLLTYSDIGPVICFCFLPASTRMND
jgi:hypothetical protein